MADTDPPEPPQMYDGPTGFGESSEAQYSVVEGPPRTKDEVEGLFGSNLAGPPSGDWAAGGANPGGFPATLEVVPESLTAFGNAMRGDGQDLLDGHKGVFDQAIANLPNFGASETGYLPDGLRLTGGYGAALQAVGMLMNEVGIGCYVLGAACDQIGLAYDFTDSENEGMLEALRAVLGEPATLWGDSPVDLYDHAALQEEAEEMKDELRENEGSEVGLEVKGLELSENDDWFEIEGTSDTASVGGETSDATTAVHNQLRDDVINQMTANALFAGEGGDPLLPLPAGNANDWQFPRVELDGSTTSPVPEPLVLQVPSTGHPSEWINEDVEELGEGS